MTHSDFLPAPRPRLGDLKSCEDWLARATLADSHQACDALLSLLEEIEDAPPRHVVYLQILERLRAPIQGAQEEHGKRFAGKSLPLGHVENAAFLQACDLWSGLLRAYRRLLRAALGGKRPELRKALPLLCQRALDCAGELINVHLIARRECANELWQSLYELYALAESHHTALASVPEGSGETTCTTALARPVMLVLAQPFGLPQRELAWTRRWILRWASKVHMTREFRDGYGVDLSGHAAIGWLKADQEGDSLRRFDFADVGRSIKARLRKLAEGTEPGELGLGRDCAQPAAGELLQSLAHAWLDGPQTREFQRRPASAALEMIAGFGAIHQIISGGSIQSGSSPWDYTRRDADQMHIFQRAASARHEAQVRQSAIETWDVIDESATGFRLRRKAPGARITLRQLVALRPRGARQFILSEVRWISEGADQCLTVGTQALPGLARGCSVRAAVEGAARSEPLSEAFLLPVGPGLPPSLVLPTGWYQHGRALELSADGKPMRIKLFGLLARGFDYDCANFSATN